ncbi:MAG: hypothetical protein WC350_04145 [Candidatus Micrarchaeia archaeon]|jgi:hypothetical protein
MIKMGDERENLPGDMLADVQEMLSEPDVPAEAKADILRESAFFGSSPGGTSLLLRWILDDANTNMDLYNTASETLGRILRNGTPLSDEDNAALDKAVKEGSVTAKIRAHGVKEEVESIKEERELAGLRKFLFGEGGQEGMKKAMVEDAAYFLGAPKKIDLLVEFMLDPGCRSEVFEAALRTYNDLNDQGSAGSDAQVSMVGKRLAEGEHEVRANELFGLMAKNMLRQVLENPHVPDGEKAKLLQNNKLFLRDPRALGVLVAYMLDSESLLSNKMLMEEAKAAFTTMIGLGLKPREDHLVKIVGTMTAGPGKRALQEAQRANAYWMLEKLVDQGVRIPRECQGKIMNAATEMLPVNGNPGYGQQKERKIYGLRGVRLILADWMAKLRQREEGTPKDWYFRPRDVGVLRTDVKHEDREVRMEAMMVNEILTELRFIGVRGIALYGATGQDEGKRAVGRVIPPPRRFGGITSVEDTPLALPTAEEAQRKHDEAARRMLERLQAARGGGVTPERIRARRLAPDWVPKEKK